MTIIDDYVGYCQTFVEKYGSNTIVFIQVGDFFEIYSYKDANGQMVGAPMQKLCDLCNLQMSRKNKAILENSRSNPLMAGFPLVVLPKQIQILVQNGYTVVVIRQTTPPPDVKREVTEIISPSTTLVTQTAEGLYFMSLYVEWHQTIPCLGVCLMDITTGFVHVCEIQGTLMDPNYPLDEIYRLYQTYLPREIILIGTEWKELRDLFEHQPTTLHPIWTRYDKIFETISYQNTLFGKVFPGEDMLSPIERIHMERMPWARMALIQGLTFAYEHNDLNIKQITPPNLMKHHSNMILEYNTALQLNVVSLQSGERPLLTILNRCSTAFGHRLFKERLLQPLKDPIELQRRYQQIGEMFHQDLYKQVQTQLSQINDLERMLRRIRLGTLPMCEMPNLYHSMVAAREVFRILSIYDVSIGSLDALIQELLERFVLDECAKYTLSDARTNIFTKGCYPELDEIMETLTENQKWFQDAATTLSAMVPGEGVMCRVESNERDGYYLTITKRRWEAIQDKYERIYRLLGESKAKPISSSSQILRITSTQLDSASDKILLSMRKMTLQVQEKYKEVLEDLTQRYASACAILIRVLADIDVCATNARNAKEFHYHCPRLVENQISGFVAKAIRHPILERIHTTVPYTTNDISMLGEGLLLFGINASGKSSLMKAIGLTVLMAQAGMYVPCAQFDYTPFHHLFTRISGNDNLYKGHSTFTVEMLELRNILRRADCHSLILGDELCAGTEWISALAIVGAGIETLAKRSATFVFATHLHELATMKAIQDCSNVSLAHMHIELDSTGKIVYDRTLRPGNGSTMYGLEVCLALTLPDDFIQRAHRIRRELTDVPDLLVSKKVSRYNTKVRVEQCGVCQDKAVETHHIQPQKDALDGFVEHNPIHRESNLVPLCEKCHLAVHHGHLRIDGYCETSTGKKLKYKYLDSTPAVETVSHEFILPKVKPFFQKRFEGWFYRKSIRGRWKRIEQTDEILSLLQKYIKDASTTTLLELEPLLSE
jgi:DNA mismatch repair protein MutS